MPPIVSAYIALASAIVLEVTGWTFLQRYAQFSRVWPTAAMAMCYAASFYMLS